MGYPDLFKIVQERQLGALGELLSSLPKSAWDVLDSEGKSPIHYAARPGFENVLGKLLDGGVNPDAQDSSGRTALLNACGCDGGDIAVSLLLSASANPRISDSLGWSPMLMAARNGRGKALSLLLEAGGDPNIRDSLGNTPLILAIKYNAEEATRALLSCKYAKLDLVNSKGESACHWAAILEQVDSLEMLLANKCNPDIADNNGDTPLHWAAKKGRQGSVKILSTSGANLNKMNHAGSTPEAVAREFSESITADLLKRLLDDAGQSGETESGAHLRLKGRENLAGDGWPVAEVETPLIAAVLSGDAELVEFLLSRGANPNIVLKGGHNALWHAITMRRQDIAIILLRSGAHPDHGVFDKVRV